MSKFTPGPWIVRQNPWDDEKFDIRSKECSSSGFAPIAYVKGDKRVTGGNGEANARLIAAAPDLLAVLSKILHQIKTSPYVFKDSDELYAACVAIEKATGESA